MTGLLRLGAAALVFMIATVTASHHMPGVAAASLGLVAAEEFWRHTRPRPRRHTRPRRRRRTRTRRTPTSGKVYIVHHPPSGLTKIGFTSRTSAGRAYERFDELDAATDHPLELVAEHPGTVALERQLHRRYRRHAAREAAEAWELPHPTEWFHLPDWTLNRLTARTVTARRGS